MKKKMMVLAALVLAVVVSAYSVSGTYAKYTSAASGSSSAVIAKWDVKLNGGTWTDTVTFNLFNNTAVYDTKDVTDFTAAGVADTDVFQPSSGTKIAPGTWGKVLLANITNNSDVTVEYSVGLEAVKNEIPGIKFSINGTTWDTLDNILTDGVAYSDTLVKDATSDTKYLYWKWDYNNSNDTNETSLATAGEATVEIKATISATQVD